MSKILTVVVPSYNVEQFLEKTVKSFIDESISNDIEILIVNDGSKDNTKVLGEKLQSEFPSCVRLIDKENGGHGSTINKGLSEAKGKYFKVVDGDDWVDTKEFVDYINKLKSIAVDVVFTPFNEVYLPSMKIIKRATSNVEVEKEFKVDEVLNEIGDCYQMHAITFNTSKIKEWLHITEHCFYVDQEYILLPLSKLNSCMFLDNTIYQYRLGDENQSVSVTSKQKNREMHKKVVYRLIEAFEEEKLVRTTTKTEFLKNRIHGLIYTQIDIFLSMHDRQSECAEFMSGVKLRSEELYSELPGTTGKLLKTVPKIGYFIGAKRIDKKIQKDKERVSK